MTNPVTQNRRHFEDLVIGEVIDLGHTKVSKEMIITFAREFDPFPFHLDEAAAKVDAENINPQPKSGQQEFLENLINRFV